MRGSLGITVLATLAVFGMACGEDNPAAPTVSVTVGDDFFSPQIRLIAQGETVVWTWTGANTHNVTFEDGQGSSGDQTAGTLERTFTVTGTHRYRCTIHSNDFETGMSGRVLVT